MTHPTFYPIQKHWKKLKPIYERPENIYLSWVELEAYYRGKSEEHGFPYKPTPFSLSARPKDHDGCDWRYADPGCGKRGRKPAFWDWACHGACHWVANTNYQVIQEAEPKHTWQIATSVHHTTVVDVDRKLMFDTNFLAMDIGPRKTWKMVMDDPSTELLEPGELMLHNPDALIVVDESYWEIQMKPLFLMAINTVRPEIWDAAEAA